MSDVTSPPAAPRKRGRRLRSAANVRGLVAQTLWDLESSEDIPAADRARLLLYGSQVLLKAIEAANREGGIAELEAALVDVRGQWENHKQRCSLAGEEGTS